MPWYATHHDRTEGEADTRHTLGAVGSTGVKGDPIEVHSEEDIFELLGMTYKSPEQRNL